eukprot:2803208-Amphidinium_carterae.1
MPTCMQAKDSAKLWKVSATGIQTTLVPRWRGKLIYGKTARKELPEIKGVWNTYVMTWFLCVRFAFCSSASKLEQLQRMFQ